MKDKLMRFAVVTLVVLFAAVPLAALEVDQYLAWTTDLEDSTDLVNQFFNRGIRHSLERINREELDDVACEDIPPRIYRYLFSDLLSSRVRRFLGRDPRIDRHPGRDVGYWKYLGSSIYRKPAFPFIMPMARTIRIDGVNVGSDKLAGHLLGFGRRYYHRYRRAVRQGHSEQEAVRKVVWWGLNIEKMFVGGLVDGIFSHADLEANFQGMMLARDLCEQGHLQRTREGWQLVRPIDLRDYVNPNFDETFNNSHYTRSRWKKVQPILIEEHCPSYRSARVQALMQSYRLTATTSPSKQFIDAYFARRQTNPQVEHSLEAICPAEVADMPGARPAPPESPGQ